MIELSAEQIDRFNADGFLILERFVAPDDAARVAARFDDLFGGRFETGLQPDEWNWRQGRDRPDHTRQICNGWKSDHTVASLVLRAEIGRCVAQLAGWPGTRLAQDNIIWKPAGAKPLGYHQDNSYARYVVPCEMMTCWMALDPTTAAGGTIEYVRGSHKWGHFPPIRQFHAPEDYKRELKEAAASVGRVPEIVAVEVPAGGCAFHHGWTWHGSDANRAAGPRRAAVAHCFSSTARFHDSEVSYIYSRYKRPGDTTMDEGFFPILWTQAGHRSTFLDDYLRRGSAAQAASVRFAL
jgi:ectoine hydroxylase-related dioxygenase (phytanoyl-CoA dioxygenase family)